MQKMECIYCHHTFNDKFTLKTHQTTAQYCLHIQGKQIQRDAYECRQCEKSFASKQAYGYHMGSRKHNDLVNTNGKILQLEENLAEAKQQLSESLKHERKLYENIRKDYAKLAEISARRSTTTNNNNGIVNNTVSLAVFDKSQEDVNRIIQEKFSRADLQGGQIGAGHFIYNEILQEGSGQLPMYLLKNRKYGDCVYMDSLGNVITDYRMLKLTKTVCDALISKSLELCEKRVDIPTNKGLMHLKQLESNKNASLRRGIIDAMDAKPMILPPDP